MSSSIQLFQTVGSAVLVVALMLGIGLRLKPVQLLELRRRPGRLVASIVVNIVVVPVAVWGMARTLDLGAEVTIGMLLCAVAPGGPIAVLHSNLARADLALTAGMTIALPALGLFTAPLMLAAMVDLPQDRALPVVPMTIALVVFQGLPLALGMLVNVRREALAARLAPLAQRLSSAILAAFTVLMLTFKGDVLLGVSPRAWAVLLSATALALVLGYASAFDEPRAARSGAIVAASRNVGVAIMLAAAFFEDAIVDATVLTYGLVSFVAPLAAARVWRRRPLESTSVSVEADERV